MSNEEKKLKLENPEIFINRKVETKYFLEYFNSAPTNILFVYGPKSTGKTTLINKIITENLNTEEYDVNFINLRMILMRNFQDFKNLFFPENLKGKTKKLLGTIGEIGAFGLKWNPGEENIMETNIFGLMEDKLRKLNKSGIKPVIILDEFQYLKDIIIDEKNNLLLVEELFKFFIGITKQYNLAHVVCLTSDSYYMEELYNDTKLSNTSDFYLIEHLSKKDIYYWLEEKEKCPEKMVKDIWKNLGGSVWEIWQVLVSYKNTGNYKEKLEDLIQSKLGLIKDWYFFKTDEQKRKDFILTIEKIVKKGEFVIGKDGIIDFKLIKELVDKDIWFYDMKQTKITANSKSFEVAFKKLLKEIEK